MGGAQHRAAAEYVSEAERRDARALRSVEISQAAARERAARYEPREGELLVPGVAPESAPLPDDEKDEAPEIEAALLGEVEEVPV